jgi:hypothetical protein
MVANAAGEGEQHRKEHNRRNNFVFSASIVGNGKYFPDGCKVVKIENQGKDRDGDEERDGQPRHC